MAFFQIYDTAGQGFNIYFGGPLFDNLPVSEIFKWAVIDNSNFTNTYTSGFSITEFDLADRGFYGGVYNPIIDRYLINRASWASNGEFVAFIEDVFPEVVAPNSGRLSVDQFLSYNDTIVGNSYDDRRLIPFLPVRTTCGVARPDALGVAFSFE